MNRDAQKILFFVDVYDLFKFRDILWMLETERWPCPELMPSEDEAEENIIEIKKYREWYWRWVFSEIWKTRGQNRILWLRIIWLPIKKETNKIFFDAPNNFYVPQK